MGRASKDYESVKNRLKGRWGFSSFYAGSYAWSIEKGSLKENSRQFRAIKHGRKEHVMGFYRDMGGRYKSPSFTYSETAREAVVRANTQLQAWGWRDDDTTAYFAIYYFGIQKKEDWDEAQESMRALAKQMKKEGGFILKIPKRDLYHKI